MKYKASIEDVCRYMAALTLVAALFLSSTSVTTHAVAGDLDPTFGSGGIVVTSVADQPYWDEPRSIQLQPDGKIVVSGEILQDTDDGLRSVSFFIARYHSSGVLDGSFGTNGKVMAPIAPPYTGGELVGEEIALQQDGKIVAVGARFIGGNLYFAVNRYNSNGVLDALFGTGGRVLTAVGQAGSWGSHAKSVEVQPDGKIVVVGSADGAYNGLAVLRYNADGSLDAGFGDGGKIITYLNDNKSGSASAVLLRPDGKIIAAGSYLYRSPSNGNTTVGLALVRYNADGSLDPAFGMAGKVLHPLSLSNAFLTDAVLQSDGKIVVSGFAASDFPGYYRARVIVRYNANGSLDSNFAINGIFTAPATFSTNFIAGDIALQSNGKIVVFGNSADGIAAARITPNGSTDAEFGTDGIATAASQTHSMWGMWGTIQPNGRILLLGNAMMTMPGSAVDISVTRLLGESASNGVTITGRVLTPAGAGLRNAVVAVTDATGARRTVFTSSLGYYSLNDVPAGETYTIAVQSRRFRFEPRSVLINDNLAEVNFLGQE